jgi:hypothetical protein
VSLDAEAGVSPPFFKKVIIYIVFKRTTTYKNINETKP